MSSPTFLQNTAQDLYARYGEKISGLTLVFPGKRAQLYFFEYLAKLLKQPMWQPKVVGIDDIFSEISGLQIADHYRLITTLYKTYKKHQPREESFDRFYFWGEVMLDDFDGIDKYLVPAPKIFSNLLASKNIEEDLSFLSEEQQTLIRSFWESFLPDKNSRLQDNFTDLWSILLRVYQDFGNQLQQEDIAYQGLIHRKAAELLKSSGYDFAAQHFIFIGFNALNECEKTLLHYLKKEGKADFYWDYDEYYTHNKLQEAGHFMRYNLQYFPPANAQEVTCFSQKKDIQIIAAPSDALQTKVLPQMLDEVRGKTPMNALERNTAIVLADEGLLIPVLYALPTEIPAFNVTMGYPLQQTPVYSLVELFVNLHKNVRNQEGKPPKFYHKDVSAILQHQYVKMLAPQQAQALSEEIVTKNQVYVTPEFFKKLSVVELQNLFLPNLLPRQLCSYFNELLALMANREDKQDTADGYLRTEYIACAYREINRLNEALQKSDLELSLTVFLSLLRNALRNIKIPFVGDPVEGVQIMGILETRALDFENLIILSLNEDIFSYSNIPSLIPYSLRKAFGLPAIEQQEALYAYFFYRLLQRAQRVRLIYNSQANNFRSGELSRYLRQLQMESPHDVPSRTLSYSITYRDTAPIVVQKNEEVMAILQTFLRENSRALSATALHKFLSCPLKFYFSEIVQLKEPQEIEEEVDGRMLGNIFHHSMHLLYKPFLQQEINAPLLQSLLQDRNSIEALVLEQVAEEFFKDKNETEAVKSNGKLWLAKQIVQKYVMGTLKFDLQRAPFVIAGLEQPIKSSIAINVAGKTLHVQLKGFIDRMDKLSQKTVIIDYKTGSLGNDKTKFQSVESLFGTYKEQRGEVFQTLLYSLMLQNNRPESEIEPALYFLRNIYSKEFSPCIKMKNGNYYGNITDAIPLLPRFEELLQEKLAGLFDPQQDFVQTTEPECCQYCPYSDICQLPIG